MGASIETIDWHNNNANIATVSGAGAGVLGGLALVGGLLAAPATGGASLAIAGAGAAASAAGAGTQLGAKITANELIR